MPSLNTQLLAYTDTMWASRSPSRFRVTLTRTDQPSPRQPSPHADFLQRDLGTLVTQDFGVAIIPGADYWWTFSNTDELGKALAKVRASYHRLWDVVALRRTPTTVGITSGRTIDIIPAHRHHRSMKYLSNHHARFMPMSLVVQRLMARRELFLTCGNIPSPVNEGGLV